MYSVAYSPDGQHIISGSPDRSIRIWDAKTGAEVGRALKGHGHSILSIAYSPDGRHIISGSDDRTIHVWPHLPIQESIHTEFHTQPDPDGWVRDSEDGLLYWVPPDYTGLHSPALLTIPPTSHTRSISLDFEDFAFGTSWTKFSTVHSPSFFCAHSQELLLSHYKSSPYFLSRYAVPHVDQEQDLIHV